MGVGGSDGDYIPSVKLHRMRNTNGRRIVFSDSFYNGVRKGFVYALSSAFFMGCGLWVGKQIYSPRSVENILTEESQLLQELQESPFLPSEHTNLVGRIQNPDVGEVILPDYSGKGYETVEEDTDNYKSVFDFKSIVERE